MRIPSHRPAIERITPYVPGKPIAEVQEEYGLENIIGFQREPSRPSLAMEALKEAISGVHIYPDRAARDLRNAIAKKYGVSSDEVFVGNARMNQSCWRKLLHLMRSYLGSTFFGNAYATHLMGARKSVPVRGDT